MIIYDSQIIQIFSSVLIFLLVNLFYRPFLFTKQNKFKLENNFIRNIILCINITFSIKIIHLIIHNILYIYKLHINLLHNFLIILLIINLLLFIFYIYQLKTKRILKFLLYSFSFVIIINIGEFIVNKYCLYWIELCALTIIILLFILMLFQKNEYQKIIYFIIYFIILIFISLTSYFFIKHLIDKEKDIYLTKSYFTLKLVYNSLNQHIENSQKISKLLSIYPLIQNINKNNLNEINNLLQSLTFIINANKIFITNKNGIVIASSNPEMIGQKCKFEFYEKEALKGKSLYFYAKDKYGHIFLMLKRPLIRDNKIIGEISFKFSLKQLLKNILLHPNTKIFFMHKSGAILFGPNYLQNHFLVENKHFLPKEIVKNKIFGDTKILNSAGYKIIKGNILQDKQGKFYLLTQIYFPHKNWSICKLTNLTPIFVYQNILVIVFSLFLIIMTIIYLYIMQKKDFIYYLKKIIKEKDRYQLNLKLFARAIKQAEESIIITDKNYKIIYVNDFFSKVTGYLKKEVISKYIYDLYKNIISNKQLKQIKDTLDKGNVWKGEIKCKNKEGKVYYENITISPIKDNQKNITHFVSVHRDITKEKLFQKQIIYFQKLKSMSIIASGIAHDFNNMLISIQGYVDLALKNLNYKDIDIYLKKIQNIIIESKDIINELLLLSKKQQFNFKNINIKESIFNTLRISKNIIPENITINTNLDNNLYLVRADKSKIEQIFLNLILNARDAIGSKEGSITITIKNIKDPNDKKGKFILCSITDTGCGICEEDLKHIFDPFFTTKEKGTGIGLSVVKEIIENHGGWIEVNSILNKGTTFKIYLPAISDTKKRQDEIQNKENKGKNIDNKLKNVNILIIEDNEDILEILELTLQEQNYNVYKAKTAKQAKQIFKHYKNNFQIIISDISLPDQNGLDLVLELLSSNPKIKVILNSGYLSDYKQYMKIIQKKGFIFLQKPYSMEFLLETIEKLLKTI
ncbi:MAG: ATP-binding protein [Desulfonauticus sp.]|nr:ATP-binding protein [Desulfonauticus sp.]